MRRPAPPAPLFGLVAAGAAWVATLLTGAWVRAGEHATIAREPGNGAAISVASEQSADAGAPSDAGLDALDAADAEPPPPPAWRISSLAKDPSIDLLEGAVGHRTFLTALMALGLSGRESYNLIRAFNSVHHFEKCNPKDTIAIAKEHRSGQLVAFEYATSPTEVWQARRAESGELEAKKLELKVEHARVAVGVAVGDDLRGSIVQAGLDDDLLKMLDDALDGHAELADVRPGARLRILATEDRIDGVFTEYGSIDAIEYTPANPTASPLRVYYFGHAPATSLKQSKHPQPLGFYYDARGRQPYHGGWRSPVPFARIASRFNPRRMHPVLHVVMPHNGVDFAAPPGTPVYATAAGSVKSVGDGGPCGNMVQLAHANGLVSAYCHLSRFASGLRAGQHVDARQLVGYVGQTGRTTGPHLHFAVKRGEGFIDPLGLKLDGVRVVPLADRAEFERVRAELDIALDAIPLPPPISGDGGTLSEGDGGSDIDETVFEESP
jgi:murein DD-endopeptidase MepM/ murein hydrolase activator NlpD